MFDTQVAAMVCGFGDAVSYETLVKRLAGASLDKASRFTDWAHRPLTERQIRYALADVIHLRTVYDKLQQLLGEERPQPPGLPRRWRIWSIRRSTAPSRARRGAAFGCAAAPTANSRRVARRCGVARGGGAAARPAARPHHARRGGARDRLTRAAHDRRLARTRSLGKGIAEGKLGREILDAVARGLADPDPPPGDPGRSRRRRPGSGRWSSCCGCC